jgi:dTMP kinase
VRSTRGQPERGWFVTLEGPEGAGKTTQAERLRQRLQQAGHSVILLREPGGTRLGESVRTLLLQRGGDERGGAAIGPQADALLFNAARAQLVEERIRPALTAGVTVLCTRFADSTIAYQGAGMGLPPTDLRGLERFATGGLQPDLTLLLDVPVEIGLSRKRGEETRFEADFDVDFHRRVRDGFLALAAAEPDRFAVIDGTRHPDAVSDAIDAALGQRLGVAVGPSEPRSATTDASRTEPNPAPVRINR